MSHHEETKAIHDANVLKHWRHLAVTARAAGFAELADHADHHADLIQNPPPDTE